MCCIALHGLRQHQICECELQRSTRQVRGIASKHGPEKSDYMQSLIAKMNDENFMLELDGLIENPLPENLSELQRSILDATNVGTVSEDEVNNLMDTHDCSATDIQREYERLKVMMEDDNRVPNSINFPKSVCSSMRKSWIRKPCAKRFTS